MWAKTDHSALPFRFPPPVLLWHSYGGASAFTRRKRLLPRIEKPLPDGPGPDRSRDAPIGAATVRERLPQAESAAFPRGATPIRARRSSTDTAAPRPPVSLNS